MADPLTTDAGPPPTSTGTAIPDSTALPSTSTSTFSEGVSLPVVSGSDDATGIAAQSTLSHPPELSSTGKTEPSPHNLDATDARGFDPSEEVRPPETPTQPITISEDFIPQTTSPPAPASQRRSGSPPPESTSPDSLFGATPSSNPAGASTDPPQVSDPSPLESKQATPTAASVPTVAADAVKPPLPANAEPPKSPQPEHIDLNVKQVGADVTDSLQQEFACRPSVLLPSASVEPERSSAQGKDIEETSKQSPSLELPDANQPVSQINNDSTPIAFRDIGKGDRQIDPESEDPQRSLAQTVIDNEAAIPSSLGGSGAAAKPETIAAELTQPLGQGSASLQSKEDSTSQTIATSVEPNEAPTNSAEGAHPSASRITDSSSALKPSASTDQGAHNVPSQASESTEAALGLEAGQTPLAPDTAVSTSAPQALAGAVPPPQQDPPVKTTSLPLGDSIADAGHTNFAAPVARPSSEAVAISTPKPELSAGDSAADSKVTPVHAQLSGPAEGPDKPDSPANGEDTVEVQGKDGGADHTQTPFQPISTAEGPSNVAGGVETVSRSEATPSTTLDDARSPPTVDGIPAADPKTRRIPLVLSANQELIRLCVDMQKRHTTTENSKLYADMSHRLQTNLAFLADIADQPHRAARGAYGRTAPGVFPRVDVFPHPSLSSELDALAKDSPLKALYGELAKAFDGVPRAMPGAMTGAAAAPTAAGTNGISAHVRERKHSRESSSTDEPNKRRHGPRNDSIDSAHIGSSPAPSNVSPANAFGGSQGHHKSAVGSASPAGSASSHIHPGPGQSTDQHASPALQQQLPPGMSPQQGQQLTQMFGANAIMTWRLLQSFLRSPQCNAQFAALPLPVQMQQMANMQQHRQRILSQQQSQGNRPNTPSGASPGSMGPPAPVSAGSPYNGGGPADATGGAAGSPASLLRRSASGDVVTRGTPPAVPMQVMNPFAATGSSGSASNASTPGPNGMPGGINGSAAHFANVGADLGLNGVNHQSAGMFPGQQFPQGLNGGHGMPSLPQNNGLQSQQQPMQGGGTLPQQLQQLEAMNQLRQQQQFFPQGGMSNHQMGGMHGAGQGGGAPDPSQLPPHLQQLLAHQQMQAASGNVNLGGAVPGSVGWPGQAAQSQQQQQQQQQQMSSQDHGSNGTLGGWPQNGNNGINPGAIFGNGQQAGGMQGQQQQAPFNGGWTGVS